MPNRTRRAVLAYLVDADGPVTVAELATHLGINHNAVRKHLAHLVGSGEISESHESRHERGRPRLLYRATTATLTPDQPYRRVAVMLAQALASDASFEDIGRAAAHNVAVAEASSPIDMLAGALAAEGFAPAVRGGAITLRACPFADAAVANPEAVCRLHLGLARGLADAIGGISVDALDARDPVRAGCRLSITECAS